jgi:hypothetical protein
MASESEIKEMVARVSADVLKEVQGSEAVFRVSDLTAHVRNIGKPDDVAWSINYSTSSAALRDPGVRAGIGQVAWSIGYTTSSAALRDQIVTPGKQ